MIIYSIYKATNKINGKRYIGFATNWPRRKNGKQPKGACHCVVVVV